MIPYNGVTLAHSSPVSSPPTEPAPESGHHHDVNWIKDAWRIIVVRRRIIVGVLALCTIALTALVLWLREPRLYEARTQLLVEPDAWHVFDSAPSTAGGAVESGYYVTQFRILRSRTLARATLAAVARPATTVPANGGQAPAAGGPTAGTSASAVDRFLASLVVAQLPDSRVIEMKFRASDPDYAARALNTHAQSYIQHNLGVVGGASQQAARWLYSQIDDQRARVEKSGAALQQYERQTGVGESRQQMASQRISELNSAVLRIRSERIAKESTFKQIEAARDAGRPLSDLAALVPTGIVQQLVIELATHQRRRQELIGRYGERHPERVKAAEAIAFTESRLESEVTSAIDAISRDVEAIRQEERRMAGTLASENAATQSAGRHVADFETLRRTLANDRALLERLQQRASELNLSSEGGLSNIRVLDPAEVPTAPVPDHMTRNVGIASAFSILLAFGLAFGVHYFDERVKSPEDIRQHLGLPFLGLVPEVSGLEHMTLAGSGERPPNMFREAIRDLRTHVLCTPAGQASRVLLVTSAGISEGKTLVSTRLATGLARLGQRVLLIDLDLRRPFVHCSFEIGAQPGLAELLAGEVPAHEALRAAPTPNLWVLTAGRPVSSPGDLIGSAAFNQLMQNLPASFDRIVIDSPPVMSCADASTIAHHQAGILFVIGAGRTDRRAAQAALDRLEAVGARFVGAVLNRVDLSRNGSAQYPHYDPSYASYGARRPDETRPDARA